MVILALFKLPFVLLGWLFKHKIMLVILVVGIVTIFVIKGRNNTDVPPATNASSSVAVQEYQKIAPDATEAPYVVATTSRIYYVANYTESEGGITMADFYVYDTKKWRHITHPFILSRKAYGDMRVYKR